MIEFPSARPTRRQLVMSGVAASALLFAPAANAQIELTDFMELSRRLAGPWELDADLGRTYLRSLLSNPRMRAALERLIVGDDDGSDDIAEVKRAIQKQWYLGAYDDDDGQAVATFERALMWRALGFDQPIGTCRGSLGFWSEPPAFHDHN
ncbi:MAG: hypothetical protein AAF414_12265 [Pseudomonadota bacterium]